MPDRRIELEKVLLEYFEAIPRQKESNPPDLLEIYQRLDACALSLGLSGDERLRHFLESKSYRKAYEYLLSGKAAAGLCGGKQ